MREVLDSIAAFFGQDHYRALGPAIAERKPQFRVVFFLASLASRFRVGMAFMVLAAFLAYPQLRRPAISGTVFQFGLSKNNERMFRRLNEIMCAHSQWRPEINAQGIALNLRMQWLSLRAIWSASMTVHERRSDDPFVNVQLALGAAAVLIFEKAFVVVTPRLVVVSNDHSPTCLAVCAVAQKSEIPVVYIQHAPVNSYFPPLRFDLSILYDAVSYDHYSRSAARNGLAMPDDIIILSPFNEPMCTPSLAEGPIRIGFCLSLLPNEDELARILEVFSSHPVVESISARRHPRSQSEMDNLFRISKVGLRPAGEPLDDFLEAVDLVLVPNSGVAIESMHKGRPTFFLPNSDFILTDHYGFRADGILPDFSMEILDDPATVNAIFNAIWRKQFRRYDATENNSISEMESATRAAISALL